MTDAAGLPIRYDLSSGQAYDSTVAGALLADLPPDSFLLADKAYDAEWICKPIKDHDAVPIIPNRRNRQHPHPFNRKRYRRRNVIERMFGRLKDFRRIATRYDKNAINFMAGLCLAALVCYWI